MRLVTYSSNGGEYRSGAVVGGTVVDLRQASVSVGTAARIPDLPQSVLEILAQGGSGLDQVRHLLEYLTRQGMGAAREGTPEPYLNRLEDVKLASPILRPEKILGIGLNYRDHCREMGRDLPKDIRTFAMFANSLVGSGDAIVLPRTSSQMDWEAELVVVIGRPAKHVSVEEALDHVAGYTIGNDISARDHQAADPLVIRGKAGDTHAPAGPWLVTRDEIPDPGNLAIELRVNGVVKQSSNTSELVFSIADIVSILSRYFTLNPGDMIFTGTPAGVGAGRKPQEWLKPGDRIDVMIEGIGTLTNICVAE